MIRMTGLLSLLAMIWTGPVQADGSAHDFTFTSIDGKSLPLSSFKGKAVLVVNTASYCGFTHQYEGLQSLWEDFRDQGLVVLGVPSNDFGAQEPGAEAEIKTFCEGTYGIDFPLTMKARVRGRDAHPFYKWAAGRLGIMARPTWNFHKYLVGPDGVLVDWFAPTTAPNATDLRKAVEAALATRAGTDG